MKLRNLFVIALLAGTLGVFGCSDDPPPQNGNGGSGGTAGSGGTDACVGPLCEAEASKAACNVFIVECNETVEIDPTPEQCDAWGNAIFCLGGTGGSGGGGGAGGAGGELCNILGCAEDADLKAKCEAAVAWCVAYCADDAECQEDECLGLDLLICNVAE